MARPAPRPVDKYQAILDAALALFVERGYHGTAVPDVARKAGVAAGTIYHYFPSKEAMVNALYRRAKEGVARAVYTAFPATATSRQQFDAIWAAMARFALDNRDAFAFLELHHHGSYLDAESRRLENQLKDFAAGFVGAGQKAGLIKPLDARLLMELVFGAFIGMMRAYWEERVSLDEVALNAARDACWDTIAVHPR